MTTEANKTLVRRYVEEVVNRRDLPVIAELFADDFVGHLADGGQMRGLEGMTAFVQRVLALLPDLRITVEALVAEGDQVAAHLTQRGTASTTGQRVELPEMQRYRVQDGRIVERWHVADRRGL